MSTCDQAGCTGHLGKFQSCQAEAVWELSLEFPEDSTGDTEYEGHYALMVFDEPETHTLEGGVVVTVPAGAYIVQATSRGAVYLLTYASADEAYAALSEARERYEEWDSVSA
jgi:hypothetical protein